MATTNTCISRLLPALLLAAIWSAAAVAQELAGRWEGQLQAGDSSLRIVVDVVTTEDGVHLARLISPDQGGAGLTVDIMKLEGDSVTFEIRSIGATYAGTLDPANDRILGAWDQGMPLPLDFARTGGAAAATAGRQREPRQLQLLPDPLGPQLHVDVPYAPTPVAAEGASHLVWELHLTNFGNSAIPLRVIEILDARDDADRSALARFERSELNAMLRPIATAADVDRAREGAADLRVVGPGQRSIAFLWLRLDQGVDPPERLRHRILIRDQWINVPAVTVLTADFAPLAAPLRGRNWLAVNGPGNSSVHRRGVFAVEGRARIAQRFAADWVMVDNQGRTLVGDPDDNSSYLAYGEAVYAVADATVVAVRDDIPENVPGLTSRAVPVTLDTLAGNYVVLDVHDGRFVFYAHLQPGSIPVLAGDTVAAGQLIGRVGNSGNSTEPHLHFHVADGPTLASEGLPYTFQRFELIRRDTSVETRRDELPLHNALVNFPARH